jgi:GAF domain-containing protein/HAMP domain-containing protein
VNQSAFNQIIQFTGFFLALIELILGLYILILNSRHPANRHASASLLLIAINTAAIGAFISSEAQLEQAWLQIIILAITTPAITPMLLQTTVVLFKPEWMRNRWRWLWWSVYILILLPAILVSFDLVLGTNLYFTGVPSTDHAGGFLGLSEYTTGMLSPTVRLINFAIVPAITILILLSVALLAKHTSSKNKKLAWLLLIAGVFAILVQFLLLPRIVPVIGLIISNTVFAVTYSYAAFSQMISERRLQHGSLHRRLTLLILLVTVPLMLSIISLIVTRAGELLKQNAIVNLSATNQTIATSVDFWLDSNIRALNELVTQPDIISMQAVRQKPVLEAMSSAYPYMNLVATADLNGNNIARNDSAELEDFSELEWFQSARAGNPLTTQTLIGFSTGGPVLVISSPIRDQSGKIIGVGMFASELDEIADQVHVKMLEDRGIAFVVNQDNQVIAHSSRYFTAQFQDLSDYPPIIALRKEISQSEKVAGQTRPLASTTLPFTNEDGTTWQAYSQELGNGWIVITQLPESGLLSSVSTLQQAAGIAIGVGILLLLVLSILTIRQSIQPIKTLTDTALGIADGDLTLVAPIESDDELGTLARTFNSMTSQLRDLITNLERRVAERTHELETRAVQLQVAAEVASEAGKIRRLGELLDHTVDLISERFDFYHAGLFLIDDAGKYAVLRAASSEGGKKMLARKHKLEVSQQGIVGYVAGLGEPRIALDVGEDAIYFDNPDLPLTRSEMGLPLIVRQHIIGVLDVQSTKAEAFNEEDIAILQILADQIALAIDNARLLTESQQSLHELENLYQQQVGESWENRLEDEMIAYTYNQFDVTPAISSIDESEEYHLLKLSISLRGQTIGTLFLRREKDQEAWSPGEVQIAEACVSHIALALENARLLEDIRRRAQNEQIIGQISANAQRSLNLDTVMKRAVKDIGQVLGAAKVQIRLGNGSSAFENETAID